MPQGLKELNLALSHLVLSASVNGVKIPITVSHLPLTITYCSRSSSVFSLPMQNADTVSLSLRPKLQRRAMCQLKARM